MKNIIFVSPVYFNTLKQRHQGLALELANNNCQVYYINPLCSNGFSCKKNKINNNLTVIDIKIPFKASSYPLIQNFAVKIAIKLLIKKLRLKTSESILWIAEPSCAEAVECHVWQKIIYDCCDLHGHFPKQKINIWQNYENKIASKADSITISHSFIKEHFTACQKNKCLLLPNATFFTVEKTSQTKNYCGKIKILSSGAHYEWVDIKWLEMLTELENVELHIAGKGRGKAFDDLLKNKKVIFHGELNTNQLFELMGKCHIGLIPFKNIELIKGVDPIKAYDYKVAGLQIWAPDIEALHSNKYINSFIKDSEQAKEAIEKMTNIGFNNDLENIPTWSERVKLILPYL